MLVYAALLVAVAAARGVFTYLQRMVLVTVSRDIEVDLRDDLFAQLSGCRRRSSTATRPAT